MNYINSKKKMGMCWKMLAAIVMGIVMVAGASGGCQSGEENALIQSKVATLMGESTVAAISDWDTEIVRINDELFTAETKLNKLEQVADPALQWVELMTTQAQKQDWNGRILEVTSELDSLKNDQYKVAKLQFLVEMLSGGIRYTSTILIDDLIGGQETLYEELHDTLEAQVNDLSQQRQAIVEMRNTAQLTAIDLLKMEKNWKVQKLNSSTYSISGQGLGMTTVLTSGTWTYSNHTEHLDPSDAAATNLRKVLTGK
jgi:hypothetical protein